MIPLWMKAVPEEDVDTEMARFRCRLAALYRGPNEQVVMTGCSAVLANKTVPLPLPKWVTSLPKRSAERSKAELHFLVRAAALFASRDGTLTKLSLACGLNERALSTYTAMNSGRQRISPLVARDIERACGGAVTKAQLNPEVFGGT